MIIKEKNNQSEKKKFTIPNSPFIEYLERLSASENRGVLAALRRGLQHEPGMCIEMYPYIMPWLEKVKSAWKRKIYYLIATLYAYHSSTSRSGNLGDVFRKIYLNKGKNPSIEQRFIALLRCNLEDLAYHLRQAIALAKSENLPIHWKELFYDLKRWSYAESYPPYEKWAQSFWKEDVDIQNKEKNNEK